MRVRDGRGEGMGKQAAEKLSFESVILSAAGVPNEARLVGVEAGVPGDGRF